MKKRLLNAVKSAEFIVTMITGAAITVAATVLSRNREWGMLHALCDGFFVSGMLLLCYAGLIFSRNQGTFDIFSYGLSHLFHLRWPGMSNMPEEHQKEKYVDYRARVSAKRKYPLGVLLAAIVYAVLAVAFFLAYLI